MFLDIRTIRLALKASQSCEMRSVRVTRSTHERKNRTCSPSLTRDETVGTGVSEEPVNLVGRQGISAETISIAVSILSLEGPVDSQFENNPKAIV